MAYGIGIGQHPQTKQPVLVVQASPEPWAAPDVLNLLRTIKKGFPAEYRQVWYEMVLPANGSGLVIPDDIKQPESQ